ncbi:hypothetical protein QVD17_09210 [Tagetes erecta]|uniref:Uncharacterized protein n=1 Tax=Tagetes erecta TaxID=13708 RepID=A0AAD8NY81_TARER|nr:hypothetical protein QVD17_09210 [Tagetes erecta]
MRRGDDEETEGELSSKSTMVNSAVICDLRDGESESKQMIDEEMRFDLIGTQFLRTGPEEAVVCGVRRFEA